MKLGFYGPYPGKDVLTHIHIDGSRIHIGILMPGIYQLHNPAPKRHMEYSRYLEWFKEFDNEYELAGYPDNSHNMTIVEGVPGHSSDQRFTITGRLAFDLRYAAGEDEVTDFTILDVNINLNRTLAGIQNRFANTRNEKAIKSHRVRALQDISTIATIVFPYRSNTFEDAELVILPYNETGHPLGMEPTVWVPPKPPVERLVLDLYSPKFHQPVVQVAPGKLTRVHFTTTWNGGDEYDHKAGEPISRPVTFSLEETGGYLPKRRVVTDETGNGSFAFRAVDLNPGDEVKVKLNIGHFSNIGHVTFQII